MGDEQIGVDEFQAGAREWLAANKAHAPRDYGAICPPDLVRCAADGLVRCAAQC